MKKEIVNLGHNDLDQLGCMLNIHKAFQTCNIKNFHTNYRDIADKCYQVEDYLKNNDIYTLLITDISFADNRPLLVNLINTCNEQDVKVVYIDHHVYPEGFFDDLGIIYSHDITKSATLLTHEFFERANPDAPGLARLETLTTLIDIYDLWQTDEHLFKRALQLNEYFWENGIDWLYEEMINNEYKLPSNYKDSIEAFDQKATEAIKKYYDKKLIHCDGDTTIAFIDEFFNQVLYDEFQAGRKIMLIANSYGIIRIRFNHDSDMTNKQKEDIKRGILGTIDIGHLNAFALKVDHNSFDHIMNEIKRISTIIKKHI